MHFILVGRHICLENSLSKNKYSIIKQTQTKTQTHTYTHTIFNFPWLHRKHYQQYQIKNQCQKNICWYSILFEKYTLLGNNIISFKLCMNLVKKTHELSSKWELPPYERHRLSWPVRNYVFCICICLFSGLIAKTKYTSYNIELNR